MSLLATVALAGSPVADAGACRILLVPKQAGDEVAVNETAPAPCVVAKADGHDDVLLVYDRRKHLTRARLAIAAGQDLGRVYFPQEPAIRAGERVSLAAHLGRVAISRDVVALQDAVLGQHFFVRDRDGQIFVISTSEALAQP